MALKFSQGLLSSLGSYGQGGSIPSDPRQRNLLQQYGVTNPLLQALGQSLGVATQNFGEGKGRVDFGSAQDKAVKAYKQGREGNAEAREAAAAKLDALGYADQAEKLRAINAQQRREAGAMQLLNKEMKAGTITQDERDAYLRGIGERTIDPRQALSLIQRRKDEKRGIELRRNEREQLKAQEQAELEARQQNLLKAVQSTEWGKNLDPAIEEAVIGGSLTSAASIKALAVGDKTSVVTAPPEILGALTELKGRGDEVAAGFISQLPDGKGTAVDVRRAMDYIKTQRDKAAAAALKEAEDLEKENEKKAERLNVTGEDMRQGMLVVNTDEQIATAVDKLTGYKLSGFGFYESDADEKRRDQLRAAWILAVREDPAYASYPNISSAVRAAVQDGYNPSAAQATIDYDANGKRITK